MSIPFSRFATFLRLSFLSALAFCFSLRASSAEYTQALSEIRSELATQSSHLYSIDDSAADAAYNINLIKGSEADSLALLHTVFGDSLQSNANGYGWLKQFLLGSTSDPWYTQYPQFRFMSHRLTGAEASQSPVDAASQQSLVYFLTRTIGQFVDTSQSIPANTTMEQMFNASFTTNSVFVRPEYNSTTKRNAYDNFSIWLAEAMRREINMTSNLWAQDAWIALNGSSNPVQVASAAMDRQQQDIAISNEVASVETQIDDMMTAEDADSLEGYDYDSDFSDLDHDLGTDADSLVLSDVVRIASREKIAEIVGVVGLHYTGQHAEISLTSHANGALNAAINSCHSVMVSVWQWIKSLAILWVVVYWYRKVRALLLESGSPSPAKVA